MSARAQIRLDPDVHDVLRRSEIKNTYLGGLHLHALYLPPEQLERKLYERVNKVLMAAGGRWNRSAKAHVFVDSPTLALGLALAAGAITDQKKAHQAFHTPAGVADWLAELANLRLGPGRYVLEPSAGDGAILRGILRRDAATRVVCCEIRPEMEPKLVAAGAARVIVGDFMTQEPPESLYDCVVMNPPFSKGQDAQHVCHAFRFLRPGGRLVAIVSAGALTSQRRPYTDLRLLIELHGTYQEDLPAGTFRQSGTNVRTTIIVLDKETK